MNYSIFEQMEAGPYSMASGEETSDYMARIFRAAIQPDGANTRIADQLSPSFVSCDPAAQTLTLSFAVEDWMLNQKDCLHGGIIATMLDSSMGLLGRYYLHPKAISTVSMSLNYMRPVTSETVLVRAHIRKAGRTVVFSEAQMLDSHGKVCADAMATFL